MCHHIFKDEGRDKHLNFHVVRIAQTKCSIQYISNIYGSAIESKEFASEERDDGNEHKPAGFCHPKLVPIKII